MGATLAADILGSGPALVDDLVLWDPCASGRAFLREQSALWTFAVGAERVNDGSVETPGVSYSAQTVSELSGRAVATGDGPLADRVLVLMRAGRTGDRRMNERLAVAHAVRMDINGQEDLVDVQPDAAKIPEETVETIVSWLAETGPTATMFLDVDTVGREAARIEVTPGGVKVEERVIRVGPVGLFGMMTSPPPPTPHTGGGEDDGPAGRSGSVTPTPTPTVLFFNAGVIDHVGPARLWVELARQWAAAGIPSFRFDISGIGDSPVHEGQSPQKVFTPQGKGDVAEVLRTVSPTDPSNSVLVGLCSGADYAIEEAIGTKVRGVCAINPVLAFKLPEPGSEPLSDPSTGEGPREVTVGMKGWVQKLQSYPRLTLMAERLPSSFWGIINRVAAEDPPVKRLVEVVDAGATVLVIAGTKEARWLIGGAGRTVRKLARSGRFRMEVIPDLEHTLFERRTREIAAAMLSEHIIGHFGPLRPG